MISIISRRVDDYHTNWSRRREISSRKYIYIVKYMYLYNFYAIIYNVVVLYHEYFISTTETRVALVIHSYYTNTFARKQK